MKMDEDWFKSRGAGKLLRSFVSCATQRDNGVACIQVSYTDEHTDECKDTVLLY
jgi:hypothetical protein